MIILLATEDPNLRLSLEMILSEEPAVTVAGAASETEGLSALIKSTRPTIVFMDWSLPGRPPVELISESCRLPDGPRFIALGTSPADKEVALSAGANAFIVKGDPPDQLLATFRAIRKQTQSTPIDRAQRQQ